MADASLTFTFVMSEKKNGKFLYIHEQEQLYTLAAENKSKKTYRCVEHTKGCKSRVFISIEIMSAKCLKNGCHIRTTIVV